jgi:hypothetical protein
MNLSEDSYYNFDRDNQNSAGEYKKHQDKSETYKKNRNFKQRVHDFKREHFSIDNMIHIKMDMDFAIDLGNFLLECDNPDKRFKSFGHNLRNLADD